MAVPPKVKSWTTTWSSNSPAGWIDSSLSMLYLSIVFFHYHSWIGAFWNCGLELTFEEMLTPVTFWANHCLYAHSSSLLRLNKSNFLPLSILFLFNFLPYFSFLYGILDNFFTAIFSGLLIFTHPLWFYFCLLYRQFFISLLVLSS